jgi:hypothetical protein
VCAGRERFERGGDHGKRHMTTMITELYDALKDAGAGEDKARKAAETVAAYENRFAKIETDMSVLKSMVGFNLAGTVALIFMQLHH